MMYCGFVVEYLKETVLFDGPFSTLDQAKNSYENLVKDSSIKNVQICRLICSPYNPEFV